MQKQRSYHELVQRYSQAASEIGAEMSAIGEFESPMGSYEIHQMRLVFGDGAQRICISAGMHGDEPAGPEALIQGLRRLGERRDSIDASFVIYPCDNPTGYELNTRENWAGVDLNREFVKDGQAEEIAIVESSLRQLSFDFTFDLHEDYEMGGFYLYERARKGRPPIGQAMIGALRQAGHPVHDEDWIEGRPASGGIIWPSGRLRRAELPKAVFLWHEGSPHLITTETPGLLPLAQRIEMQAVCFNVVIDALEKRLFLPEEPATETERTGNSVL